MASQDETEISRAEAETARTEAERERARAEEGRELAEEIRRSAEALRVRQAGSGAVAEHGRHILEAATRAEAWFKQRFDVLLEGSNVMQLELKRLRQEAAELRRMLSDMEQAAREEQDIAAERQATQRRMERERFTEPR